jgi:Uma2 family endonuclease
MSVAFVPEKTRISVDRYQKMVAAGVLTECDRIELIDGEMINSAPIGPVNLGDFSEPQPDVLLLRPRGDYYAGKIPEASDVLLLIEISDSTLAFDQSTKRALYARHGVVEYWIVDVERKRIQVHREPTVNGYAQAHESSMTDSVSPQALPAVRLIVQSLFM